MYYHFSQYFTVVLFLFVIMLIGGIFGYVFREKLSRTLQNEMQTSMRFYDSKKVIREAWDVTQRTVRIFQSCILIYYNFL